MPLNDTEILVLATKTMKFTEEEALEYLKKKGHPLGHAVYYRTLGRMSAEAKKRIYEIAKKLTRVRHDVQAPVILFIAFHYSRSIIYHDLGTKLTILWVLSPISGTHTHHDVSNYY